MPSVALRHICFQRLERGWLKEEGGKGEVLVMRRKFTAPGWEYESSFWKIKLLSGNEQHKAKVYEFKDLKWTLTHKGRKEIHRMLRDHRMARKPGEQGSHKGQGQNQVRLDWDGWRCVFFPFPPACTSVLISKQRTGNEEWSSYIGANFKNTLGANCKSNQGSHCLESVYRNF